MGNTAVIPAFSYALIILLVNATDLLLSFPFITVILLVNYSSITSGTIVTTVIVFIIAIRRFVLLFSPVLLAHSMVTKIDETALFGEVTWAATEKLKFIAGARAFRFDNSSQGDILSSLGHTGSGLEPVISHDQSSAIGRFNVSYNFTSNASSYLQIAQGYRPGGTNDPGVIQSLLGIGSREW